MELTTFDYVTISLEILAVMAMFAFVVIHAGTDDDDPRLKYYYASVVFLFFVHCAVYYYSEAVHWFHKLHEPFFGFPPSRLAITGFLVYILACVFFYFKRKDTDYLWRAALGLVCLIIVSLMIHFYPNPPAFPWRIDTYSLFFSTTA